MSINDSGSSVVGHSSLVDAEVVCPVVVVVVVDGVLVVLPLGFRQ